MSSGEVDLDGRVWQSHGQTPDTVVVGVTGHRSLVQEDEIVRGIDLALRTIERAFGARSLTLISPLARGADQLVARRALLRPRCSLVVPLPLPLPIYLGDFAPASREGFLELLNKASTHFVLPVTPTREEAYEATGLYVVEHSDALIAVWDGRPARGRGGTASIVARARQQGLPMAWIKVRTEAPGALATLPIGGKGPMIQFERFPDLVHLGVA